MNEEPTIALVGNRYRGDVLLRVRMGPFPIDLCSRSRFAIAGRAAPFP
jgi:hypothetical protein